MTPSNRWNTSSDPFQNSAEHIGFGVALTVPLTSIAPAICTSVTVSEWQRHRSNKLPAAQTGNDFHIHHDYHNARHPRIVARSCIATNPRSTAAPCHAWNTSFRLRLLLLGLDVLSWIPAHISSSEESRYPLCGITRREERSDKQVSELHVSMVLWRTGDSDNVGVSLADDGFLSSLCQSASSKKA
jgi:hypothetical protein